MSYSAADTERPQVFVGLDVHKETIRLAALHQRHFVFEKTIETKNLDALRKAFGKLRNKYGPICACYEASGAGYSLQRLITAWGINCTVIAPSLMPTRPGDRRKTDEYDARKLAEFFANGQLTAVRVPTPEEESVSDLVRCRMATKKTQIKAKHQLVKFLAKKGCACSASAWSKDYEIWLSELKFSLPADEATFGFYRGHLEAVTKQLEAIDSTILEVSQSEAYREKVAVLKGFYGVETLTAMVLTTQLGDSLRLVT